MKRSMARVEVMPAVHNVGIDVRCYCRELQRAAVITCAGANHDCTNRVRGVVRTHARTIQSE
jgi:hypothetical protein